MDHVGILKRAFNITRRYRVLWIFGALLALFGSSGGGNISAPGGRGDFPGTVPHGFTIPEPSTGAITGVAITCCFLLLIFTIAGVILSYVARTALYRMVDEIEETGNSPSWRQGFRLGWSRRALRLFGIDLVIGIPFAIAVILLIVMALLPLFLLAVDNDATRVISVVFTIGLLLVVIAVLIVAGVLVNLAKRFMHRQAVLDDHSIGQSIVLGVQMVRANAKDSAVMWLLMFGMGLAWGIVMIPVFIIVALLATAVGGLPAWLIWQTTEAFWLSLLVGIPLFLVIMVPPLVFLDGLYRVFQSTAWTLTYRQFRERVWEPDSNLPELEEGELDEPVSEE